MTSAMDLNDVHKAQIQRFAQFFKTKRDKIIQDRGSEMCDFISDRLSDESAIFNAQDVSGLIQLYHSQVMAHLQEGLETTTNLSAVYISQLMAQAEQMGAFLQVEDISLVEDQSRLGQITALAALQGAPLPVPKPRAALPTISQPAGGSDPAVLQELQDVKVENQQMKDRYQTMQTELTSLLQERSTLSAELEKVTTQFNFMLQSQPQLGAGADVQAMEQTLAGAKATLAHKDAELDALRNDLNTRLGDSAQFRDLKAILKKKTEEIKNLRAVIVQLGYQPPEPEGGGIELSADSD